MTGHFYFAQIGHFHFAMTLNYFYLSIITILTIYSIFITNIYLISSVNKNYISRNFFVNDIKLKNYQDTKFKITDEGKKIINNIKYLHKSETLITAKNRNKDLCAGYIWVLTEKIWGKDVPKHIGMIGIKSKGPAEAWELPDSYKAYGGEILIDLGDKFTTYKKDFWEKISKEDINKFFNNAFSEKALFGDIGFFYKYTTSLTLLNKWSHNSHITKNVGYSNFEFTIGNNYKNKSATEIISNYLNCSKYTREKLFGVLENYDLKVNGKRVLLKNNELFYLDKNNNILDMVKLKYLDKISYNDITLSHFFKGSSRVNGLFDIVCSGDFFPINVISINPRFIEKI